MMTDDEYLIWSNEHVAWWGPNRLGYVRDTNSAGRYSRADAIRICVDALGGWRHGEPPPEIPVRALDALALVPLIILERAQP